MRETQLKQTPFYDTQVVHQQKLLRRYRKIYRHNASNISADSLLYLLMELSLDPRMVENEFFVSFLSSKYVDSTNLF